MNNLIKFSFLIAIYFLSVPMLTASEFDFSGISIPKSQIANGQWTFAVNPGRNDPGRLGNPNTTSGNELFVMNDDVIVSLVYNRNDRTDVEWQNWSYRVSYQLANADNNYLSPNGKSATLEIIHDNEDGVYLDGDLYESYSGFAFVVITSVEATNLATGVTTSDPSQMDFIPDDIHLELSIKGERIDFLDAETQCQFQVDYDPVNFKADLMWNQVDGAEEFEIEWFYWDLNNTDPITLADFDRLYKETGSRIRVSGNNHQLDIVYPDWGVVVYRLRPVGRFIRNVNGDYSKIKNGKWTDFNGSSHMIELFFSNDGFEKDEIWQHTLSFAEDGKYKNVIGFMDESLKPRQSVTNLSTEETVLVAEQYYDTEGRSTVSILPTPISNPSDNNLFFKPEFNKSSAGVGYNRTNFDQAGNADPLDNGFGASKYFSANNASSSIHKDYIPDAEEYPLTQVKLMRDGTGRVEAQSGIGANYQLGSGRETKYFYSTVSDTELHRLFGDNVGDSKYYKKNAVLDANGQLSISYADHAGRTIATALAGESPDNVQQLDSEIARPITINLMSENEIDNLEGTSSLSFSLLKETPGNELYSFHYDLTGVNNLIDETICTDCKYKLKISIEAPDGKNVLLTLITSSSGSGGPILTGSGSSAGLESVYSNPGLVCDLSSPSSYDGDAIDFEATFTELGTYIIHKELILVSGSIEELLLLALEQLPVRDSFVAGYVDANLDETECNQTACELQCYEDLLLDPNLEKGTPAFDDALATCIDESCNGDQLDFELLVPDAAILSCDGILQQMIADVSPGGCLFESQLTNNDFFSINRADLDSLEFEVNNYDDFGFQEIETTDYSNYNSNDFYDFIKDPSNWQDQWAEVLVTLHPEYCRYEFCKDINQYKYFDFELQTHTPWGTLNGYTDYFDVVSQDPIMNATDDVYGLNADFLSELDDYCDNNLADPNNSASNICSGGNIIDYVNASFDELLPPNVNPTPEEEWRAFVAMYLEKRLELLYEHRDDKVDCDGSNISTELGLYPDCEAIDNEPEILSMDGTDVESIANTQMDNAENLICANNVELWMSTLANHCPVIANPSTPEQIIIDSIRAELEAYCETEVGVGVNPMGLIFIESSSNI